MCHALTLVILVFFIILVRSGCDYVFILSRGFVGLGVLVGLGVFVCLGVLYVYVVLIRFPIRDSCLSLSLIGDHI